MKYDVYVCDRCHEEYQRGLGDHEYVIKYGVDVIRVDEWNRSSVNLCKECIDSLQAWFYEHRGYSTFIDYKYCRQNYQYTIRKGKVIGDEETNQTS